MSEEGRAAVPESKRGPLDVKRVMAALPHRYPMLLVDRVEEIVPDRSITAIKAVTINEDFSNGHFPGRPLMPGVLIVEALAQAAGVPAVDRKSVVEGKSVAGSVRFGGRLCFKKKENQQS